MAEDVAAYQVWIDRIKRWHDLAKLGAQAKRRQRQMRNLKNKANGGFGAVQPRDVQAG